MREMSGHLIEKENLKNAYAVAELELLKQQINPHLLFNSLSSLSGIVREDPGLAQHYIKELSNVFRYSLRHTKSNLVNLGEELKIINSFAQLIKMRMENAFEFSINVEENFFSLQLPQLSLQPLLENAVKHNAGTILKPLKVVIYIENKVLVLKNTLSEIPLPDSSNGLGLINLNERYKILTNNEISIFKTKDEFIVKLPLL